MTVEFTQEVSDRLLSDKYGWLTTVAKSGQPVPRLARFAFDGKELSLFDAEGRESQAHSEPAAG